MSRGSIGGRRLPRPSTSGSTSNDDTIATTVEIVERATSTLQGLQTAHALQIWRALGVYIQDQLAHRRPVRVDQFGVFGLNESIEPVFLAEASFLQTNRLRERERNGQVLSTRFAPVGRANSQQIGEQYLSKCRKEVVAAVIASVVALVSKWAKQGHRRGIRLGFLPVGEWQCDSNGVVSFRFLAEFRKHLRLGTTGVTAAQVAASISCGGYDADGTASSMADKNSVRTGTPLAPKTRSSASTRSTRPASGGRSCPGSARNDYNKSREDVRSAEYATTCDLSSDMSPAWSTPASVPDQGRKKGRHDGGRAKTLRPSTSATSVAASTTSKKTTASSQQAWAAPRTTTKSDAVFARLRLKLALRCGLSGLNSVERSLQSMVQPGGTLTRREIKFGLRDLGVEISAAELDEMADAIADHDGRDRFRLGSIISAMRGSAPLQEPRLKLIERAFKLMDTTGRGVVTVDDLKDNYDVSALPKVRSGKQSAVQALAAFLREWDPDVSDNNAYDSGKKTKGGSCGGSISLNRFVRYYHNVSACIADDSEFERIMRQLWHVSLVHDDDERLEDEDESNNNELKAETRCHSRPSVQSPAENSSLDSHEVEEAWQYLEALLLPKKWSRGATQVPSLDAMCHRVGANRVLGDGNEVINTHAFAHALSHLDRRLEPSKAKYLAVLAASTGPNQVEQEDVIYLADLYKTLTNVVARENCRAGTASSGGSGKPSQVIDKVRKRLLKRVALSVSIPNDNGDDSGRPSNEANPDSATFHGLARSLRLMDKDGDQRLSKDELKAGLCKFGVDTNFREIDCLFAFFDTDQSGCISCDEFVVGMRGEMNERRLALVRQAFGLLDTDGDGQVTLKELQTAYDCSKHPGVVSGEISAQDAIRIFASQWETNEPDGIVTRDEFETYYKNLSASIDSDDYFELMMRNAWHISGGEGQCANSTNRRLLLTDADGSERVVEVRNDLGINATDFARMRANLEAQGVLSPGAPGEKAANIQLYGSLDRRDKRDVSCSATRGDTDGKHGRKPVPDRRFYRRCQFAQPDAGGRSLLAMAETSRAGAPQDLETQRTLRARAAELIQSRFRGFRARKLVALVRRKLEAERQRRTALEREQAAANKRRVLRAATRTVHGF